MPRHLNCHPPECRFGIQNKPDSRPLPRCLRKGRAQAYKKHIRYFDNLALSACVSLSLRQHRRQPRWSDSRIFGAAISLLAQNITDGLLKGAERSFVSIFSFFCSALWSKLMTAVFSPEKTEIKRTAVYLRMGKLYKPADCLLGGPVNFLAARIRKSHGARRFVKCFPLPRHPVFCQ